MLANRGNALSKGSKLQGGRYVIDGTLGEGAFGITYRARDTRLNRTVAIKELYPGGSQRRGNTVAVPAGYTRDRWQKSVASFLREAQTIASLEHPAIVAVYDQFEENNTAYMVMRFIDGANLMQLAQQRGGRLPEADTLRYIAEVGEALSVLHANGVLHRDVKPSNVIVNRSGHAVLVDFGAARAFVPDQTLTHSVVLTPGFAPPEQFQPRARRGPTTDIYALAATCYYLLTGNLPDIMDDGRLDDPHLSPRLRAALEHALAYAPAARPQTVAAFLAELQGRAAPPVITPSQQAFHNAPTAPNPPKQADTPIETVVESPRHTPAGEETVVESSQQRGYTLPPMYPLPADEYIIEQPKRRNALPIIGGSLAAGVLLVVLAVLLLGGKGSAGGGGSVTLVVAANTPTPLLAAATQTPVMIAIVPPTDTPLPTATPIPPSPTSAPLIESTPIPLALGGAFMIHNIGMVASCTDNTIKPTYQPNEHFFVMVQSVFSRTQVYEIHPLWQMPPNYSTVIDARVEAMSIDNPSPGLRLRDGEMYYVCFEAIPPKPQNVWQVGNYRVDIYINNGTLPVISKDFAVMTGAPTTAVPASNTPLSPNPGNDPSKVRTYTINAGDTLASVAAQFGVNTGQLMAANNAAIKHPSQLQAGQTINIPAPSYSPPSVQWTVQPGENLTRIIRALQATDTSLDKIAAANPCQPSGHGICQPGYSTYPGDTITIPFH